MPFVVKDNYVQGLHPSFMSPVLVKVHDPSLSYVKDNLSSHKIPEVTRDMIDVLVVIKIPD